LILVWLCPLNPKRDATTLTTMNQRNYVKIFIRQINTLLDG